MDRRRRCRWDTPAPLNEDLVHVPEGFPGPPPSCEAAGRPGGRAQRRRTRISGRTPRRSPSPRSLTKARRSGSPARTPCAGPSASATPCCTTRARRGHVPIQHLPGARASFELHNSPLSEYACLGFEYGYAATAPEALVLWEAQYGDFVNGAEIIIDQFLIAGLAKWRQTSRLTLLLPHGYGDQGRSTRRASSASWPSAPRTTSRCLPHHAGAVLPPAAPAGAPPDASAGGDDAQVAPPAAPGDVARPGILPTGLPSVLDDPRSRLQAAVPLRRVILCSGKVYYPPRLPRARASGGYVAVVRCRASLSIPQRRLEGPSSPATRRSSAFAWVLGGAAEHGSPQVRAAQHQPPRSVQHPAGRRLAPRTISPGRGLPGGAPGRAGPDRGGGRSPAWSPARLALLERYRDLLARPARPSRSRSTKVTRSSMRRAWPPTWACVTCT